MRLVVFIGLILLLIISCTTTPMVKSKCWQKSYFSALVTETEKGYKTRIVYARNRKTGEGHAQAQAFIDGRWQWLTYGFTYITIADVADKQWSYDHFYWNKLYYITKEQALIMWGK